MPIRQPGELLSYRGDLPMRFGVVRILRRRALTSWSSRVAYVKIGQLRCAFGSFPRAGMGTIEMVDEPIISRS
jgi:hypothetical protein